MHLLIDIQAAVGQLAGIGRYTRELLRHLPAELGPGDRLTAAYFDFHRRGLPFVAPSAGPALAYAACRWCPGAVAQQLWKRLGIPAYTRFFPPADVCLFPNYIIPPLPPHVRAVATIHDVSVLRLPETTEKKNLRWMRSQIFQTAARADAILTDSQFSAREIVETLHVPAAKVHAIPLGLPSMPPPLAPARAAALRTELGLSRPYILHVGTIEPRKNIPFLLDVLRHAPALDADLVLAGGLGWKTDPILAALRSSPLAARVHLLSHVPDDTLSALYDGALAFVFPSLYEGFGLPPLEALARGTPVLAADNSSLPEVLSPAATLVPGYDPARWAAMLQALVANPPPRARLVAHAARFSYAATARQTLAVLRSLML